MEQNFELFNLTNEAQKLIDKYGDYLAIYKLEKTISVGLIALMGILANISMLCMLFFTRKRWRYPRVSFCMINLAIGDLMVCSISAPLTITKVRINRIYITFTIVHIVKKDELHF